LKEFTLIAHQNAFFFRREKGIDLDKISKLTRLILKKIVILYLFLLAILKSVDQTKVPADAADNYSVHNLLIALYILK
jgi:hypothetical protein